MINNVYVPVWFIARHIILFGSFHRDKFLRILLSFKEHYKLTKAFIVILGKIPCYDGMSHIGYLIRRRNIWSFQWFLFVKPKQKLKIKLRNFNATTEPLLHKYIPR